jgi:hypothetical protein
MSVVKSKRRKDDRSPGLPVIKCTVVRLSVPGAQGNNDPGNLFSELLLSSESCRARCVNNSDKQQYTQGCDVGVRILL